MSMLIELTQNKKAIIDKKDFARNASYQQHLWAQGRLVEQAM